MENWAGYSKIMFADRDELVASIADDLEQYRDAHDESPEEFLLDRKKLGRGYDKDGLQDFVGHIFRIYDDILDAETSSGAVDSYRSRVLDESNWRDQKKSIEIPSTLQAA